MTHFVSSWAPASAVRTAGPVVSLSHASVQVGTTFNANLNLTVNNFTDPQGLGAYEVRMNFDKTRVKVNSVMGGAPPFHAQPTSNRRTDGDPLGANTVGFLHLAAFPTLAHGPTGDNILIAIINVSLLPDAPVPGFQTLPITVTALADTANDDYTSNATNPGSLRSSGTPVPTISVGSVALNVGPAISGNVSITAVDFPALGLAAYELQVHFDAAKVKVNGVAGGAAPFDGLPSTNLPGANTTGVLVLSAFQNTGAPAGTFSLAVISVSALATGTSTLLVTVKTLVAVDGPTTPIESNVVHGSVTGGGVAPTAGFAVTLSPPTGIAPVTATFTADTGGSGTTWSWSSAMVAVVRPRTRPRRIQRRVTTV